ncbi:hypothetical protein GCM10010425_14910 [Streptomyces spororaveus]|uniref:Uncharacterized protein n=1 Tax=Streptomyces spororaveus TaxID=284039 RepID=A0ABQ3T5G7_9ACTN|nr:hypothetical protein Sspor_12030 [Streptomyces spororaveus]
MCGRTYRISCRIVGSTELSATNALGAFASGAGALAPAVAAPAIVRAVAAAVTATARRALIGGKDVELLIEPSICGAADVIATMLPDAGSVPVRSGRTAPALVRTYAERVTGRARGAVTPGER